MSTIGGCTCGLAMGFLAFEPILATSLFCLGGALIYVAEG